MTIQIVPYEPSLYQTVERFLDSRPEATPYHHPSWWDVYQKTFGHTSLTQIAIDETGSIQGLLPMLYIRWPSTRTISVPHRDRGGPLAINESIERLLFNHFIRLAETSGITCIKMRGIGSKLAARWTDWGGSIWSPRITLVKRLGNPGEDVRDTGIASSLKRALRKAESEKLTFRNASEDLHSWNAFYQLFVQTRKRLGVPPYPWRFFHALASIAMPTGICKLFLVEKDGKPLAGMVVTLTKQVAIYAYGASDSASLPLRPNDYLMWQVLQWCTDIGIETFDFGSDQRNQEGLLRFKSKWNVEVEDSIEAVWAVGGYKHHNITKQVLTHKTVFWIHQRLPLWVLRLEASFVFRFLD